MCDFWYLCGYLPLTFFVKKNEISQRFNYNAKNRLMLIIFNVEVVGT